MFHLTASVVRGPSEVHPVFTVSLKGVAIDHEKVKWAVAWVQDFVRHPLFTQRIFFSETGISMLNTAVTAAEAVRHSSEFDPWGAIGVETGPVIADLKSCREKVVTRKKAIKYTWEHWFGAETVASSAVGEAAPRTTVRISDVVRWEMFKMSRSIRNLVFLVAVGLCQVPRRVKRGECQWVLLQQKKFRLLAVFFWICSWEEFWAVDEREGVFEIVVMPQFSKGDIINYLSVYMYRLLAFEIYW